MTTERECSWTATSDSSWLNLSSSASGSGSGALQFSVRPNPDGASRAGSVIVNGQQVRIAEAAAPCNFALDRNGEAVQASGGSGTVRISGPSGCGWSASTDANWLTLQPRSGSGSGTLNFSVPKNTGGARQATVAVAGLSFTVAQAAGTTIPAPAPTPSPGPTPPAPQPVKVEGTVSRDISGTCPALSLVVDGSVDQLSALAKTTVITTASTRYTGTSCNDLRAKNRVRIFGTRGSDGRVTATSVELVK